MSSVYTLRVTLAVPDHAIADANQLALLLGESASDDQSFRSADLEDVDGHAFAVVSTLTRGDFPFRAQADLTTLPNPHGADIAAAQRAQALLRVYNEPSPADPDHIVAVVQPATETDAAARAGFELTPINPEPI